MPFSLLDGFWNLLFPRRCVGCNETGDWICANCATRIEYRTGPVCAVCKRPVFPAKPHLGCRRAASLDAILAMANYGPPLKQAIHHFKYQFVSDIGLYLGGLLAQHAEPYLPSGDLLTVPVPLHRDRLRWRGFNQAAVLGKTLASRLSVPFDDQTLFRIVSTAPQVGLQASSRESNVAGAFSCVNPSAVIEKTVLLVDDVSTTTATLGECARTLKSAGAKSVWGLVVAQD